MSNAVQVTQAAFSWVGVGVGGGFSTTLLLTTGGLLSCSDLSGYMVINVFDLFLLSCLGAPLVHMERPINAREAAPLELVWLWPPLGPSGNLV